MKPRDEQGRWTKPHYVVRAERVDVDQDTQVPVDVLLADASPTLSRRRERAREAAKAEALEKLRRMRPLAQREDEPTDFCSAASAMSYVTAIDSGAECVSVVECRCGLFKGERVFGTCEFGVCLEGAPQ